jgi:hypothetical protein
MTSVFAAFVDPVAHGLSIVLSHYVLRSVRTEFSSSDVYDACCDEKGHKEY